MKYLLSFLGIGIIVCAVIFCGNKSESESEYMRIHIKGNSNSVEDSNIKYDVKDNVVEFLIPYMAEATNKEEALVIINENMDGIEDVINSTLQSFGVNYGATVCVKFEEMPARAYGDLTLDAGVYESLNIVLGEGKGDNWWCVVFPAVCFVSSKNSGNYEYISKIWEIINSVT